MQGKQEETPRMSKQPPGDISDILADTQSSALGGP